MAADSSRAAHVDRVLQAVHSPTQAGVSAVAASWCRSALHHRLDPAESDRRALLAAADMLRLREENGELLAVAQPVLDTLYSNVRRTGCCVLLTNAQGVILESRAADGDVAMFESVGLASGANWSEAAEGTNGIGTCLAEGRPVTIHRDQHFATRNIGISCMDAPVFDPEGRLAGALDISSGRQDHSEAVATLVLALVQDAAHQIERDLFCQRFAHARIICSPGQSGRKPVLLAVDKDDLVIGATHAARQRYGLFAHPQEAPQPAADIIGTGGSPAGFEDSERAILRQALARSNGNVTAAARALGISRATFYRRMERAGLAAGDRGTG